VLVRYLPVLGVALCCLRDAASQEILENEDLMFSTLMRALGAAVAALFGDDPHDLPDDELCKHP
jgi:hypothetical protein